MKPAAIIGTGPCLTDVHDFDALVENRWCLGMNGVIVRISLIHAVSLCSLPSLLRYWRFVNERDTQVFTVTESLRKAFLRAEKYPLLDYDTVEGGHAAEVAYMAERIDQFRRNVVEGCTMIDMPEGWGEDTALAYALRHVRLLGYETVELYGIDLNSEQLQRHLKWIKPELELIDTVVNCCPSSEFKGVEFVTPPWTEAGK